MRREFNDYTKLAPGKYQYVCKICGEIFVKDSAPHRGSTMQCCSWECRKVWQSRIYSGSGNPAWRGGEVNDGHGYVLVYRPGHHRAGRRGKVRAHILVAEKAMGKQLPPGAEVHHINCIRHDNRPQNLVVCQDHAYHMEIERKYRRLKDTGALDLKRCIICGQVFPLRYFYVTRNSWDGKSSYCKSCEKAKRLMYYHNRKSQKTQKTQPVSSHSSCV